jgi:hypothetical protein
LSCVHLAIAVPFKRASSLSEDAGSRGQQRLDRTLGGVAVSYQKRRSHVITMVEALFSFYTFSPSLDSASYLNPLGLIEEV